MDPYVFFLPIEAFVLFKDLFMFILHSLNKVICSSPVRTVIEEQKNKKKKKKMNPKQRSLISRVGIATSSLASLLPLDIVKIKFCHESG